jgi:cobalt-zinc-cadmium efflux system protein
MSKISELLNSIEGVLGFHHVHVWELDSGFHIITAHLVVKPEIEVSLLKQLVRSKLLSLGPCEVTLEIEREGEICLDPSHPSTF